VSPIYILQCTCCENEDERNVKYQDLPRITCSVCGGTTVVKPARSAFKIEGYSEANGYSKGGKTE
jgi:predicted nucleic acid-binding Zn ribbon protein